MLSAHGEVVLEDSRLPADKIIEVADGYLVQNVTGIRVHIVSRLDGKGYDIAKCKAVSSMAGSPCSDLDSGAVRRENRAENLLQ